VPEETSAASPDAVPEEPPAAESPVPEEPPAAEPPAAPRPRRRRRIALVAGAVVAAMAVAVAVIALTASPANPYATPDSYCALVSPATVAKYLPGQAHRKSGKDNCVWIVANSGYLFVSADVADSAAEARTDFAELIRSSKNANSTKTTTVTGTRVVTGLGDQATAMFSASTPAAKLGKRGSGVFLFIRTRNALIQVVRTDQSPGAVRPAAMLLPDVVAIAREVMAAMPLLGPGSPGVGVHISLDVSHPVGGVILREPGRGDQHRGVAE